MGEFRGTRFGCPGTGKEFQIWLVEITKETITHHDVLLPVQCWILSELVKPVSKQDPRLPARHEVDREVPDRDEDPNSNDTSSELTQWRREEMKMKIRGPSGTGRSGGDICRRRSYMRGGK